MSAKTRSQRSRKFPVLLGLGLFLMGSAVGAQSARPTSKAESGPPDPPTRTTAKPDSGPNALEEYTIGVEDVLDITVWHEKELSGPVTVRSDGKITVPLVNEIYVVGLTPKQLQGVITEKLSPFITVPQVTVSVRQINSRRVFLVGEVTHKGPYQIGGNETVLQLLAEAGGLTPYAKAKKMFILRTENGRQIRLPFNYKEVIQGKYNQQNIVLRPGDIIVAP